MEDTALPAPGLYGDVEIRHPQRGRWYAVRHRPDGTFDYLAQNINLKEIAGPSRRDGCLTPDCPMPVWHRNLCGMCLAADIRGRIREIGSRGRSWAQSAAEVSSEWRAECG